MPIKSKVGELDDSLRLLSMSPTPDDPDLRELARARQVFGLTTTRIGMILLALNQEEVTAAEFMDELGLSRSGVERQLKVLTNQGIFTERRGTQSRGLGQVIYWRIAKPAELQELWNLLSDQIAAGVKKKLAAD